MRLIYLFTFALIFSMGSYAQQDIIFVERTSERPTSSFDKSKLYYGGYVNVSFGKYTVIGLAPLVGYKLTPKFSLGSQVSYEYSSYSENSGSNYGLSVFSRYRVVPQFYLHVEYSVMSYKVYKLNGDDRKLVPFLFLGGGLSQAISKNTWFTAQVLFDVLNNNNSPYKNFEPFFSVGIGVGF